jgi:hypothetical protein
MLYCLTMARTAEICRNGYQIHKTTNTLLLFTGYFNKVLKSAAAPLPANITHLMFPARSRSNLRLHVMW